MKIACLLGVTDYKNCQSLPGCSNDIGLMKELLDSTGEYDFVRQIDGDQPSAVVKQHLVEFFKEHKGKDIEQVLFYFTGHGQVEVDGFHYVLSDYSSNTKKQTALENSELDDWLRMLNPKLAVKIVDACHAGVSYIKDLALHEKSMEKSRNVFSACYFLYSSLSSQSSFLDSEFSDFTRSLVKSVAEFKGSQIRFKDLIDAISDEFRGNPDQTPFFVTQGTSTEVFCSVTEAVRNRVCGVLNKKLGVLQPNSKTDIATINSQTPILDVITKDAARFCTEQEVVEALNTILKTVKEEGPPEDLEKIYRFKTEHLTDVAELPNALQIGKWLEKNSHDYFAQVTYRDQQYEVVEEVPFMSHPSASSITSLIRSWHPFETRTVTKTRSVTSGFYSTHTFAVPAIKLVAESKFPNVRWHELYVTYVYSKVEIRFFYMFTMLREQNWDVRESIPADVWQTIATDFKGKSTPQTTISEIIQEFYQSIGSDIRSRFKKDKN